MASLREIRDMISKYPKSKIKVSSWLPFRPEGGIWGKNYILRTIDYMLFLRDSGQNSEYWKYRRNYGDLIDKAYEVAKKEVEG